MTKKCAFCGKEFDANRKYCTVRCRKLDAMHRKARAEGRHLLTIDDENGRFITLDFEAVEKAHNIKIDWENRTTTWPDGTVTPFLDRESLSDNKSE